MTIIFEKKVTPAVVARIKQSDAFVAFITKNFVEDKDKEIECEIAEKLNKPMYAIIDKEIDWKEQYEKYPWRKIFFRQEKTPEEIVHEIKKDLDWFRSVGT